MEENKPELPADMKEGERPELPEGAKNGEKPELPEGAKEGERPEMKEEIFLALFEREYDRWNEDLISILEGHEELSREQLPREIATSLEKRTQLLRLLSMNNYDMEANSRLELLASFKASYGASMKNMRRLLERFCPEMDDSERHSFIYTDEDNIVIEESDDGVGIEPDRLGQLHENNFLIEEKNRNAHIGLCNIYERLWYIYGDKFSMDIFSEPGEGVTVVISSPIISDRSVYS